MWKVCFFILVALLACCKVSTSKLSASYHEISSFLARAGLKDPGVIYFATGNPTQVFPSIHCFDREGRPLQVPPDCFRQLENYVGALGHHEVHIDSSGQANLAEFLQQSPIMDAYDRVVNTPLEPKADVYLFVSFIAISDAGLEETLATVARLAEQQQSVRIRLFLVHAISERNIRFFSKQPGLLQKEIAP